MALENGTRAPGAYMPKVYTADPSRRARGVPILRAARPAVPVSAGVSDSAWTARYSDQCARKSFLACASATEACLHGITTRYLRATRLFAMLRAARGEGTYFNEIARLAKTSLLVIDDFGLTPVEPDDRLALLEILDDRYRRLGTIVSAQLSVSKWHAAIGEPTIADAVMDWLAHTPYVFDLKGGSRRTATQLS